MLTRRRRAPESCEPHSLGKGDFVKLRNFICCLLLFAAPHVRALASAASDDWKTRVNESMPLLGHRNWILVVDSAYPLQTSPGIETIETNANQLDVVRSALDAIHGSIHIRPVITMDAELPFVPDADAQGVSAYRRQIGEVLRDSKIEYLPHDKIIANLDEAGKTFHILVLKTNMTIPYTSVFIRLDCKYWSADAEARLRAKMRTAQTK
jgi:hypothetical protein